MLDKEAKVQGVGIYAEFSKPGATYQILFTPDCYTHAGTLVPMSLHRRVVTPLTPKKQWKQTPVRSANAITDETRIEDSNIQSFAEERLRYATPLFNQLSVEGWTLRNKPILIEISRYDADDIAKSKTPNKALYRVHISRKAQGFPEELV